MRRTYVARSCLRLLLRPRELLQRIVTSTSVYVCLSVCEDISGTTSRSLPKFVCMLPIAVARSSSGRVTKSQGDGQFLEFPFPLTMHCTA